MVPQSFFFGGKAAPSCQLAGFGRFSGDRTIAEYAADIWRAKPCPVPSSGGHWRKKG
jgi:glucan phosphorylase